MASAAAGDGGATTTATAAAAAVGGGGGGRKVVQKFVADPHVVKLKAGERPAVWGIGLNVLAPPPGDKFKAQYEQFVTVLQESVGKSHGVHVYPYDCLHITVAALVNFNTTMFVDPKQRQSVVAAWNSALETAFTASCDSDGVELPPFPTQPFDLVYEDIVVSKGAVFFMFKNPTGEINAIRERVRQVCSNDEALRDLGVLEDDAGFKIPGIIHTSFVRYAQDVEDGDAFASTIQELAAKHWSPISASATSLQMVLEDVPYMHIKRDAEHLLAEFPFTGSSSSSSSSADAV